MATPTPARTHAFTRPPLRLRRDGALRSLAAKGDPQAFAELYERHHQALYRYCRSIVQHDEDARDALHSTMTRAFAALASEERDFEVKPWLFRIAHNEAVSILRKRRETDELQEDAHVAAVTLERQVADREGLALLRADLAELSERQRAALVMRELSGLSHVEIGKALDMTPSKVKQTIFDARSALLEFREGREMPCETVQRSLSDGDGRALRGRKLRSHLRSCRSCGQFRDDLRHRPAAMAAMVPPLPPAAGAALLEQILHGSAEAATLAGAKTAAVAGIAGTKAAGVATVSGVASGGGAAGGLAAKIAVAALAVTAGGGGTAAVVHELDRPSPTPPPVTAPARPASPVAPDITAQPGQKGPERGGRRTGRPGGKSARRDRPGRRASSRAQRQARRDRAGSRGNRDVSPPRARQRRNASPSRSRPARPQPPAGRPKRPGTRGETRPATGSKPTIPRRPRTGASPPAPGPPAERPPKSGKGPVVEQAPDSAGPGALP